MSNSCCSTLFYYQCPLKAIILVMGGWRHGRLPVLLHSNCLYYNFFFFYRGDETPLTGKWSTRGCSLNEEGSSETVTVCECTHLTHFAILLSTGVEVH